MRDGRGLASRSGGGHRCGSAHLTSGDTTDKTPTDLLRDAKLAPSKGPRLGDGVTSAAIPGSFCLEQSQHPLRAVRRPHRHDPPVSFT